MRIPTFTSGGVIGKLRYIVNKFRNKLNRNKLYDKPNSKVSHRNGRTKSTITKYPKGSK